ncbi:helix-turn-helix domain-containing protein [Algicola sagamiensis]|uniref:helix-turn-helix domain-containing protein n=1 Tax=Algicola sagamiensis TaxID=163869 RepID=UPI00037CEE38|nr:helix-turn-helix domain-containing protein [Algicola sagamiensis]
MCDPLEKAIQKVGSQTALAKVLNKKQGHVWNWLNRDKKVPAEMVIPIEKVSGVSRHELRPDIYPLPEKPG